MMAGKPEDKVLKGAPEVPCLENSDGERTREALRQSEAKLTGILHAAPIGVGMVVNRVFQFVNDQMCRIVGYSPEELVGKSARILYESDEEFGRVGKVKYDKIMERGIGTIETRFVRQDGALVDILLSSCPIDPSDLLQGVIFTALDITSRKRSEEALRESEANYRLLFSKGSDAIIVVDAETRRIVDANEAALALYEYDRDDLLGLDVTRLSAEPEKSAELLERVASGKTTAGSPGPVQRVHKKRDGATFPVEISAGAYALESRKMVCIIMRDITERKRMEDALKDSYHEMELRLGDRTEELVRANEDLNRQIEERRTAEKGLQASEQRLVQEEKRMEMLRFANDVALKLMHELRNPLVSIGGFSRRIHAGDYTEDKLKEYARVILEGSMRLDNVLSEVLSHLKAAAEKT